jgi:hypothetical protein
MRLALELTSNEPLAQTQGVWYTFRPESSITIKDPKNKACTSFAISAESYGILLLIEQ